MFYKIWHKTYFNGEYVGTGVSTAAYKTKKRAETAAQKRYKPHGGLRYTWVVSETNPFAEDDKG